jgi:hypothetical protein
VISFRYHLVSIVAMFLFLALGIVVGTTALNGPITKDLRNQVNDTKSQRDKLAVQNKTLQDQVDNANSFATTYGADLVAGKLTGKQVLVVTLPGASSSMQSGVIKEISASGATISGHLTITKDYLDPSLGNGIITLATGAVRPIEWTAPETSDATQIGGSLLAWVLAGKGKTTDLTQVLGAFSELHMVSTDSSITSSTSIVVVGKGSMKANSYAGNAELALVGALAKDSAHVVVAGDPTSAQKSGLVALVRDTGADRNAVSTVDNADSAFGQVSSVLALSDALTGQVGHYGTESGADALFPTPAK